MGGCPMGGCPMGGCLKGGYPLGGWSIGGYFVRGQSHRRLGSEECPGGPLCRCCSGVLDTRAKLVSTVDRYVMGTRSLLQHVLVKAFVATLRACPHQCFLKTPYSQSF
jgi:hypothetical protein